MVARIFLISVLLITFVSAQDIDAYLGKMRAESFLENPCVGERFARNTRGCSWFFVCDLDTNEVESQNRCPPDMYFNEEDQLCDNRENVECDIPSPPTVCPEENGVFIISHPQSCSKFTVCFDQFENDRICPAGTHFSYYDGDCVDPFLADCSIDYNTCRESSESGIPTFVADLRDCSSFYVCVGGTSVLLRCAPGTHFAPEDNWCAPEPEVNCEPEIPIDRPEIPEKISIDCEGRSGLQIPHPDNCQFFFFCAGNRSYLQICGEGLNFDTVTSRCQTIATALCINATEPTEGPTEVTTEVTTETITEPPRGARGTVD